MNTIDYLLIAAVVAAAGYTTYRLFLGWLRTRSLEMEDERTEQNDSPQR